MSTEIRNKVEYIVVMIAEFAKAKHLTESQAFRYLKSGIPVSQTF